MISVSLEFPDTESDTNLAVSHSDELDSREQSGDPKTEREKGNYPREAAGFRERSKAECEVDPALPIVLSPVAEHCPKKMW